MLDLSSVELSIWTATYSATFVASNTQMGLDNSPFAEVYPIHVQAHHAAVVMAFNAVLSCRTDNRTQFPQPEDWVWKPQWEKKPNVENVMAKRLTFAREMYLQVMRQSGYELKEEP